MSNNKQQVAQIKIFIVRPEQEHLSCIEELLKEANYRIYSIPQVRVENIILDNDSIISFGVQASLAVKQVIKSRNLNNINLLELPKCSLLVNNSSNQEERERCQKLILSFLEVTKSFLQNDELILSKKDVESINVEEATKLVDITVEDNNKYFTKSNGLLVQISNTEEAQEDKNSLVDISVTFKELISVKTIMDLLKTDKVTLRRINKKQ